ncbi:MG2 domain-containing protein [Vibrio sp. PP-XX7]
MVFRQKYSPSVECVTGFTVWKTAITSARVAIYQKNNTIELGVMTQHQQSFDYQVKKGDVLVIQQGHQTSVLPLKEVPLDLSDFQVTGRDWQKTEAFVYSNRDLFKPGETLPLNIVLRDQDGQSIEKQRLYIEYRKPDGHVVGYRWLEPTAQVPGFYQDQFSIPASAPLGRWTVFIKSHQDAKRPLNQFSFNVSEFVPERMDMNIDLASGLQNKVESLPVRLEGNYLFGAPADGNQVNISAFYQPRNHFEGKLKAFFVGEPFTIRSWKDVPEIKSVRLDHDGKYQFDLPTDPATITKIPGVSTAEF